MKAQRRLVYATALVAFGLSAMTNSVCAATFHVRKDGSGDFTSIQACVNGMAGGDTCIVGPGVYEERIQFPSGKSGSATAPTTLKAEKSGAVDIRGVDTARCNYLRIEDFNISIPSTFTGWTDGVGIAVRSSNVDILGNYLHDIHYAAISGHGDGIAIRTNHIFKCGIGINVSGNGWLVERNNIERLQKFPELSGADNVRFSGGNHLIRGNRLFGTLPEEIGGASVTGFESSDSATGTQHVVIENNLIEGFYRDGVMLDAAREINRYDVTIRNNLFVAPQSHAVAALRNVRDVKIYNNSVINPAAFGVRFAENSTGEVKNNIFYADRSGVSANAVAELTYSADATSSILGGKNLLFISSKTIDQSAFPNDIVNKDPLFVSFVSKNYRIRAGSPAINAAATLSEFNYDLNGTARPQGPAWDIGAYEYPVNAARPAPPNNIRISAK